MEIEFRKVNWVEEAYWQVILKITPIGNDRTRQEKLDYSTIAGQMSVVAERRLSWDSLITATTLTNNSMWTSPREALSYLPSAPRSASSQEIESFRIGRHEKVIIMAFTTDQPFHCLFQHGL